MSVENENLLIWYKNEEKYINENTIAALLQNMLNKAAGKPYFRVYINEKATIEQSEKYTCVLKTRIEPYMLKGAHCESVNVRLNVIYPIENASEKIFVLNTLNKCLGFLTGGFKYTDEDTKEIIDYTFCSNFSKEESSTPENINSHWTASIIVRGNMHITRGDGGLLGDMVENYIVLNGTEYAVVGKTVECSEQANMDSPIKKGAFRPSMEINARTNAKTLILLYRNDYICNILRDLAHGILANTDNPFIDENTGNLVLTLKETYPAVSNQSVKVVQDTYYIYEVKETREAGAYMALSVALIKKP